MKTLPEFYDEILADETLKAEFAEASENYQQVEFFAAHGVTTTAEELTTFAKERINFVPESGELSEEQLDAVVGGVGGCPLQSRAELSPYAAMHCAAMSAKPEHNPNGHFYLCAMH